MGNSRSRFERSVKPFAGNAAYAAIDRAVMRRFPSKGSCLIQKPDRFTPS